MSEKPGFWVRVTVDLIKRWYFFLVGIIFFIVSDISFILEISDQVILRNGSRSFLTDYYLLVIVGGFIFFFILLPNYILGPLVDKMAKSQSRCFNKYFIKGGETILKIPEKYLERIHFANNILIGIVGVTLGLFKLAGSANIGPHESRMVILLMLSLFFGVVAVIYQITPKAEPDGRGYVCLPKITRHLAYSMTFLQVTLAIGGYSEAALSLLSSCYLLGHCI